MRLIQIIFGMIGGAFMLMASVDVATASTNFASWFHFAFGRAPDFARLEQVDFWAFCLGLALVLVAVGLAFLGRKKQTGRPAITVSSTNQSGGITAAHVNSPPDRERSVNVQERR